MSDPTPVSFCAGWPARSLLRRVTPSGHVRGGLRPRDARVYRFLRSQVRSREVAEDIAGKVFEKVCASWEGVPVGGELVAWIFRVAHTTLLDHWRVDGRRERVSVSVDENRPPGRSR